MGKWDDYFIQDTPPPPQHPTSRDPDSGMYQVNAICVNNENEGKCPGAWWIEPSICVRPTPPGGGEDSHRHDFDEYLLFMSLDYRNFGDLGGEVEFWIEDEKHVFDKSTAIFIPAGAWHCPLRVHRVDRPFLFMGMGNTLRYHFNEARGGAEDRAKGVVPKLPPMITDELKEIEVGGKKFQVTKMGMELVQYMMDKNRRNFPK